MPKQIFSYRIVKAGMRKCLCILLLRLEFDHTANESQIRIDMAKLYLKIETFTMLLSIFH